MQRYKMANDLGRGWSQKCFQCLPSVLGADPQNSLRSFLSHGGNAFVDKQQQRDVTQFICRGFGQQEDHSDRVCHFLLLSEDQPSTCSLLPRHPLLCLLKAAYSHCRWGFFFPGVAMTLIGLLIPGPRHPSQRRVWASGT